MGGSPGLEVSRSEGHGFEYPILDGHFFTNICYKNCNGERPKINEKGTGVGPFFKKKSFY